MTKLHSYTAYGLNICSAILLPELVSGPEGAGEVTIRLGEVEPLETEEAREAGCTRPTAWEARLFWNGVGRFLVRNGREIIVEPEPDIEERVLRLFILGPTLALLLHQRGLMVLHASAVEIGGAAIAFLGGSGWGKSTTAAALYGRGHGLVADDVVALELGGDGGPILFSGFPQLKLWPEVAATLGEAPESMAQLHPDMEKLGHRNIQKFSQTSVPLERLYVLEESDTLEIEHIRPQEAVIELVRHTYLVRQLQDEETSSHFHQCSELVKAVPVRRLKRPLSLSVLSELARIVEDDATNGG
jgi:hypothetical protein